MSFHLLFKASLRALRLRLMESIVVILVIAVGTTSLASIDMAADYSIKLAGKAWAREVGNIVIVGRLPRGLEERLSTLNGVEAYKVLRLVETVAYVNKTPISLALIYNPSPDPPAGYVSSHRGRIMVYVQGGKPLLEPGSQVFVPGYGALRIEGTARSIVKIVGGVDVALLAPEDVVDRINGSRSDVLLVVTGRSTDPGKVAKDVKAVVLELGGSIERMNIQTETDNPASRPMKAMAKSFNIFVSMALIAAALLIAGNEFSLLERNVREVGVLKAMGFTAPGVALYYAGCNTLRGVLGAAVGSLGSMYLSGKLVEWGASRVQGHSTVELLMERYPFTPDIGIMAKAFMFSAGLTIAASLIPPLLAYRVSASRALRFAGLEASSRIRVFKDKARAAYIVRRALSRAWRAASLVILLGVIWGVAASIPMSLRGYHSIYLEYKYMGYDVALSATLSEGQTLGRIIAIARSIDGVVDAEAWGIKWSIGLVGGERVSLETCILGKWRLEASLSEGRWPGPGEAAITETLAKILGKDVGDFVDLSVDGRMLRLAVVGIVKNHRNNGRIVYLSPDDYCSLLGCRHIVILASTRMNAEAVGIKVKNALLEAGVPAHVSWTKSRVLDGFMSNEGFLKLFLTIFSSATLIVGFAGLSSLVLADLAGRLREVGVLRAIGFTNLDVGLITVGELLVLMPLAAILAYLVGGLLSSFMLGMMIDAVGYVTPAPSPLDVLSTSWIPLIPLPVSLVLSIIYLRRQPTSLLLRAE